MLHEYHQGHIAERAGRECQPLDSLADLLVGLLNAAMREISASAGFICVPGFCEINAGGSSAAKFFCGEIGATGEYRLRAGCELSVSSAPGHNGHRRSALLIPNQPDCAPCAVDGERLCAPVTYQKKKIGCVVFTFDQHAKAPVPPQFLQSFAREIAFLVKRHDVNVYARRKLGIETSMAGPSRALRRLEETVEKVSQAGLPVLIEAEFGSKELAMAAAIHYCSARSQYPFVVMHCAHQQPATFAAELAAAMGKARNGSLFFKAIDELDPNMQKELLSFITSRELSAPETHGTEVRILASASRGLEKLVQEGRFCRFLRTEVEVLKVEVPPLRSRREDMRTLLEHELRKHASEPSKEFSQQVMALFEAYEWPENLLELERVVARLATMTDGNCINVADVQQHLGWLLPESWNCGPSAEGGQEDDANLPPAVSLGCDEDKEADENTDTHIVELARRLIAGDYENLDRYGVGMQRALTYVGRHFDREISLTELAKQSFFSPSHLSFLFKKTLGMSFKGVLTVVRIEKAKQLLLVKPNHSITELSLDAGFGDLSHFEKTFKRITGLNPREFRRRNVAERSGDARRIVHHGAENGRA